MKKNNCFSKYRNNYKRKIFLVAGARPNFMKIAPIYHEIRCYNRINPNNSINAIIIHTGQHYDKNMSDFFFRDLGLPKPDIYLGVGSGSHAVQTANVMVKFEKICLEKKPDLIVVVGDINSTLACSVVAAKLLVPVAHIESGLRSFDRTMPEEINRIITDSLSDYLFTTCSDANVNLKKEGIFQKNIFFVGNVMIDTLIRLKEKAQKSKILQKLRLKRKNYAVLTLHRPSNVDNKKTLQKILEAIKKINEHIEIVFPVHPRTIKQIEKFGLNKYKKSMKLLDPLAYIDFLQLYMNAKFVLTDSGGIQEETTYLGIPCLTLRENTERPITIKEGTNVLVGSDENLIIKETKKILNGNFKRVKRPKFWDGRAAQRIVKILGEIL